MRSALNTQDSDEINLLYSNTRMDSTLPVQEGSSIMTSMSEQGTMEQSNCTTIQHISSINTSARGLFDYDLHVRTRNNGTKVIVKQFSTSVP